MFKLTGPTIRIKWPFNTIVQKYTTFTDIITRLITLTHPGFTVKSKIIKISLKAAEKMLFSSNCVFIILREFPVEYSEDN